jgi:Flp pilus assembly protein TadD
VRDAQGKPAEAVKSYREAVRLRPNDASFHVSLGAALRKTGDFDGALTELRQATHLAPQDALALTYLGLLLSDKKVYDEAHETLEKATKSDPKLAAAWTELGRMEMRRKQPAAAAEALARARALKPKDATIAADYCRALTDKDIKAKGTQEECRAAVALDGSNALARYELSKVLVAHGDCAAAKSEFDRFAGLAGVKPEAKAKAQEILKTCTPAKSGMK